MDVVTVQRRLDFRMIRASPMRGQQLLPDNPFSMGRERERELAKGKAAAELDREHQSKSLQEWVTVQLMPELRLSAQLVET